MVGWNESPSGAAGYIIHYGPDSGNYPYSVDVGKNTSCSISGLEVGETYYFAATAYDSANRESEFSEELVYTTPAAAPSEGETAIDNSDPAFTTAGSWKNSSGVAGFYGSNYQYTWPGNGDESASWTYKISSSGQYEISARWTAHSNRAPDAPYSIYNNGRLLDTIVVDQRTDGGQFNVLETYTLDSGTLKIVLTNDASGYVVADATQIVLRKKNVDETIIPEGIIPIDNSDPAFTTAGSWKNSSGVAGFYGSNYQYTWRGNGDTSATWTYKISSPGQYKISARWTAHSNRAPDAPYSIYNNGRLLDTIVVDQRTDGGQFNLLETYTLDSGTLQIVLTNNASGYVVADAIQIVF
jgi:hypothetical protein